MKKAKKKSAKKSTKKRKAPKKAKKKASKKKAKKKKKWLGELTPLLFIKRNNGDEKMKKIILFLITMFLIVNIAYAQGQNTHAESVKNEHASTITGIPNAILRVQNQEVKAHLEQVLNRIREREMQRLNNLTSLKITQDDNGNMTAEGRGEAKFLGFINVRKTLRYSITEQGEIQRIKRWHDIFFKIEE